MHLVAIEAQRSVGNMKKAHLNEVGVMGKPPLADRLHGVYSHVVEVYVGSMANSIIYRRTFRFRLRRQHRQREPGDEESGT